MQFSSLLRSVKSWSQDSQSHGDKKRTICNQDHQPMSDRPATHLCLQRKPCAEHQVRGFGRGANWGWLAGWLASCPAGMMPPCSHPWPSMCPFPLSGAGRHKYTEAAPQSSTCGRWSLWIDSANGFKFFFFLPVTSLLMIVAFAAGNHFLLDHIVQLAFQKSRSLLG